MTLRELLKIQPGVTAVIGSGGKTTLLRTLGAELAAEGHTVILCSTTKIFPFDGIMNLISPEEQELSEAVSRHRLICLGTLLPETGKLSAPEIPMVRLAQMAEYVLVEADGSARKPLKAHGEWEPAIPPESNQTICVVGLSGLGRPVSEVAHRPERFAPLAGISEEDAVTPEAAARVLNAEGLADRYLLNQAEGRRASAEKLSALLNRPAAAVSLKKGVYEPCL